MGTKFFKIYLLALVFTIIQFAATALKTFLEKPIRECCFDVALYIFFLFAIIRIAIWAYHEHKEDCRKNGI